MLIEKVGTPKDIWVMCPNCQKVYYVERLFWEPKYDHLQLFCPLCRKEFDKNKAPKVWGL